MQAQAKKWYYEINVSPRAAHKELFEPLLVLSLDLLEELDLLLLDDLLRRQLTEEERAEVQKLLGLMRQVDKNARQHELQGVAVANADKLFSIFETHTDIIVKGQRDISFGHKVLFASGKSNLMLDVEIPRGNPADSDLTEDEIKRIKSDYECTPEDVAYDGGFASKENVEKLQKLEVKNIVFNKTVGSLQNIAENKQVELGLKRWRAGMEAVISNIKRGFDLVCCVWKGWEHFQAKVYWSVIGYNIRTMSRHIVKHLRDNPIQFT